MKEYKAKIAVFTKIPLFLLFSYETSIFVPEVEVTPPHIVEQISRAFYPQLVFRSYFSHQIEDRCSLFTDASKTESYPHIGAACYSPDIPIQRKYKLDGNFSIFSAECIAIISAIDCVLEKNIKKASIFTDSRSAVETLSNCVFDRDLNYLILVLRNKLRSAQLQNIDISSSGSLLTWASLEMKRRTFWQRKRLVMVRRWNISLPIPTSTPSLGRISVKILTGIYLLRLNSVADNTLNFILPSRNSLGSLNSTLNTRKLLQRPEFVLITII